MRSRLATERLFDKKRKKVEADLKAYIREMKAEKRKAKRGSRPAPLLERAQA